jgi:hypothetical protein
MVLLVEHKQLVKCVVPAMLVHRVQVDQRDHLVHQEIQEFQENQDGILARVESVHKETGELQGHQANKDPLEIQEKC